MSTSRRVGLAAVAVLVTGGLAAGVTLVAGGSDPPPSAQPTVSSGPSPSPSPTRPGPPSPSATSPSPSPSPRTSGASPSPGLALELRGDDLGVTRIGASRSSAVAAVAAVLGPGDTTPPDVSCVGSAAEVVWPDLRLGFDADDRLNGWSTGTPRLQTPSGVRVGTRLRDLRRIYGDSLRLFPPNPDHGHSFALREVDLVGYLDGDAPGSRVTALANGACTGP